MCIIRRNDDDDDDKEFGMGKEIWEEVILEMNLSSLLMENKTFLKIKDFFTTHMIRYFSKILCPSLKIK